MVVGVSQVRSTSPRSSTPDSEMELGITHTPCRRDRHTSYNHHLLHTQFTHVNTMYMSYGVVWHGLGWCGMVWCGMVWCGVVQCGVVWCAVVRCGMV